jgi:hypothetical protein
MSSNNEHWIIHLHACVLPMTGGNRFVLWVQSPNEQWMLLSGFWHTARGAARYAEYAGYQLMTDKRMVLDQIERQSEARATGERPAKTSN